MMRFENKNSLLIEVIIESSPPPLKIRAIIKQSSTIQGRRTFNSVADNK